ncbi:MAG: AAA family ATPase [Deltaproteobacteria bacterium]|nr:AAA family ATPase [Deltaproteobacteria bacterium]
MALPAAIQPLHQIITDLAGKVRAHYPLIGLRTTEEERAERVFSDVSKQTNRHLVRWTTASGFILLRAEADTAPNGPVQTKDPTGLATAIDNGPDNTIYLLEDFGTYLELPVLRRALRDHFRRWVSRGITLALTGPTIWPPDELATDMVVADLPLPCGFELEQLVRNIARAAGRNVDALAERIAAAAGGLTEAEASRLFHRLLGTGKDPVPDDIQMLIREKKQLLGRGETLEFFESPDTLASIAGLDNLKEWLVSRERAFSREARDFGLPEPKGLFLLGVQGCGKSLTAKAVANLWRLPLLRFDLGSLFSSGKSGPEELMRRSLQVAASIAPAVLWIDEIEKGFAGIEGGTGTAARLLGSFITWMQEKNAPVFVVATANSIEQLPPELLRKGRFDEIFFVDLPSLAERRQIFEVHLKHRRRDPAAFDLDTLAAKADKFSGAEIEAAIVAGLYEAFSDARELNTADIMKALKETVPLALTQQERIKALKDWAEGRARRASADARMLDLLSNR